MYKNYIYIFVDDEIKIVGEFIEAEVIDTTLKLLKGFITKELLNIQNGRSINVVMSASTGRIEYQDIKLDYMIQSPIARNTVIAELSLDITDIEPQEFKESASEFYQTFQEPHEELTPQSFGITEAPGIF